MNLIVDIGNTSAKLAVMDENEVVCSCRSDSFSPAQAGELIARWAPAKAIVSSTRGDAAQVCRQLQGRVEYLLEMTSATPVPIEIAYASRDTLGTDRIAAAAGAVALLGREADVLIVDCGTAITVDRVSAGRFLGGNISPGAAMRLRALHQFTSSLPLCSLPEEAGVGQGLGDSTRSAIERGVMQGIFYEIKGYVDDFLQENPQIRIIFCGGDAKFFVNRIKNAIFAECKMMYIGLNAILEYNATIENI